jgi:hypothetical protein
MAFISSGDKTLNELLGGGFTRDLVYLLCGDEKKITEVLLKMVVMAQHSINERKLRRGVQVVFIDGNGLFTPYITTKYAVKKHVSPQKVLGNMVIPRVFTCDQMMQILNKVSIKKQVKVILISGITSLFQVNKEQDFGELLKNINHIKEILEKSNPLLILSAPFNAVKGDPLPSTCEIKVSYQDIVIISMQGNERFTEYILVRHPSLPENRILKRKPRHLKRPVRTRNVTLDNWL